MSSRPLTRPRRGILLALAFAATFAFAQAAAAVTLTFSTPISGDVVPVTLSLADAPGGDRVEITVSIPGGEGDLLGLFGNVVDQGLVPGMAVDDATGAVTQWQFQADKVWKVGGGNTMSPVKQWDWGLKLGENGSGGGMVTSASFALTGPGLDVQQLLAAVNQGYVFGVRIQSTNGAEGSSKMGLSGDAPRIRIQVPAAGELLAATPTPVSGTVLGTGVAVDVNGVAAAVASGAFDADVPLTEGPNTLLATATNAHGTATDAVDVVLDTAPPVVTITDPPDGSLTAAAEVLVQGSVTDASPIATFTLNGQAVALDDGAFQATLPLALGDNPITAEATDAAGNTGSDAITVVRGEPPTVRISAPADGALVAPGVVAVSGTVVGTPAPSVEVNGVTAAVSNGSFSAEVPVAEGANVLTATATNSLGTDTASVTVTAGLPPTVQITAPADGLLTSESPITVTGTVTGTAPVSVDVNGAAATVSAGSFTATVSLTEGGSPLAVTATNPFGSASASVAVTLDTTPPVVTILTPADGSLTTEGQTQVSGSVEDASPIASLSVAGVSVALAPDGSFATTAALDLGANLLQADAVDAAGNAGSAAVTVTRGEPPTVGLATPADGALLGASPVTVSGPVTGTEPVAVTVNGVSATVAAGSYSAQVPLSEGANALDIQAENAFGSASAGASVTLDTTPPVVAITAPADGSEFSEGPVGIFGTVVDASPITALALNGSALPPDTAFATQADLAPGANVFTVQATDAVGLTGSASVTVTLTETGPPLALAIQTPPDHALVSSQTVSVAGTVSDAQATLHVNGAVATVTGERWAASGVPLEEGENLLTATATRGTDTASDTRTVVYNVPPQVVITSPREGATLRLTETDVEGLVDDPAAFVDVNGVRARVGSAGRFVAPAVPLEPGPNLLAARAVDALGATGRDDVGVTRDDASAGRLQLVFVAPRYPRPAPGEFAEQVVLIAENLDEFREELRELGYPPELFDPPVEEILLGASRFHLFVFTESGVLGAPVSVPAILDFFFVFGSSRPLLPMTQLEDAMLEAGVDPAQRGELVPEDFVPNGFVHFEVPFGVPQ